MNLIIDCNQASRLPTDRAKTKPHSLSLSPKVLAEIFLRTNPIPTLERIRHYHFKVGLDIADVMLELSRMPPEEITSFEPFYSQRKTYQQDYEGLIAGIHKPTPDHAAWAAKTKEANLEMCAQLIAQSQLARKAMKEVVREHRKQLEMYNVSAEEKPSSYEVFLPYETPNSGNLSFTVLSQSLHGYGCEANRIEQIYGAVMSNPYLRRLFRCLEAYFVGRAGGWKDQENNFSPSLRQDDVTDILLPLYAADGDAIITEDKMITKLVGLVEVGGRPVIIQKASDI